MNVMKTQKLLVALIFLLGCGTCLAKDTCFSCHLVMEGMSLKFTNDIHYSREISCVTCHGGDANETNQNISMNASRGFKVRVTRQGVPQFCGNCHADTNFMGTYDNTLPTDQLSLYTNSVHGKLLAAGRRRSAECVDCHSVHDIRPPDEAESTVSPQHISETCAKCHAATLEAFAPTPHGKKFVDEKQPGCTVCHSAHATAPATDAMLTGSTSTCIPCHKPDSKEAGVGTQIAAYLATLEAAGPDKKDALTRARVAVHSMNLDAVKHAAETPPPDDK